MTRDAMLRIDKAQKASFAADGRYIGSLADFAVADKVLARELTVPLDDRPDRRRDGKSYLVRVSSDVLSVARARSGDKVVTSSCRELKSRGGSSAPSRRRRRPRLRRPPRRGSAVGSALVGAPARAEPQAGDVHVPALRPPARLDERPRAALPRGRALAAAPRAHRVRSSCARGRPPAALGTNGEDAAPARLAARSAARTARARRHDRHHANHSTQSSGVVAASGRRCTSQMTASAPVEGGDLGPRSARGRTVQTGESRHACRSPCLDERPAADLVSEVLQGTADDTSPAALEAVSGINISDRPTARQGRSRASGRAAARSTTPQRSSARR